MVSRSELEAAFTSYAGTVQQCVETGDWSTFASAFTDDCRYIEHLYGTFHGPHEVVPWIKKTMVDQFPGNEMIGFPSAWEIYDEERGWVVCDIRNIMKDPGDGTVYEASNITILRYGRDGLWAEEEDIYNPFEFQKMGADYAQRCHELGTLSDPARKWCDLVGVKLRD